MKTKIAVLIAIAVLATPLSAQAAMPQAKGKAHVDGG